MPRASGDAATRIALTRFMPASLDSALDGRCEPTTTTGIAIFTVRLRKYAVSSSVAVPWPMTMPARSGCCRRSVVAQRDQRLPVGETDRRAGDISGYGTGNDIGHLMPIRPARDDVLGVHHVAGRAVILQVERTAAERGDGAAGADERDFRFQHDQFSSPSGNSGGRFVCQIGVALIRVGDLHDPSLGERPAGDLHADRATVRVEPARHADRRQTEIIERSGVGGDAP